MEDSLNYEAIARAAADSLRTEGRHNQADIMSDIAAELARLRAIEQAAMDMMSDGWDVSAELAAVLKGV